MTGTSDKPQFTQPGSCGPLEPVKALAGERQADLPGFGQINDSIRLVSKGTAIEETLSTPADNEISVYTRDEKRLVLTDFCALTTDGHVVRRKSAGLQRTPGRIELTLVTTNNLHDKAAPHMRRVLITFIDRDHLNEKMDQDREGCRHGNRHELLAAILGQLPLIRRIGVMEG